VCSLIFISSLIYPFTIYEIFNEFFRLNPSSSEILQKNRDSLILWLTIIQLIYLSVVFFVCIFISHKIAGPMYKLSNFLDNYIDGNPPNKLYFRKGDNFTEIADKINLVFERFDEERSQDFEYLKEVSLYIKNLSVVVPEDKKPVISEITTKLDQILSRY
jgi:signal transduction histidine kinase